ncbi:MAG: GNAT family N-acetyltransferase [Promethearchaeota archaeon]
MILIRDVRLDDAKSIITILNPIISAGKYSVLVKPLTITEEKVFISNFPEEGIFHVAERLDDKMVVGFQTIEPFGNYTQAFDHVGVIGTFIDLSMRQKGIGIILSQSSFQIAKRKGYEKLFTNIRSDNKAALAFYNKLGFSVIGTARKHAKIGDRLIDEIFVEKFL